MVKTTKPLNFALFVKTLFVTQQKRGYCHHCIPFFYITPWFSSRESRVPISFFPSHFSLCHRRKQTYKNRQRCAKIEVQKMEVKRLSTQAVALSFSSVFTFYSLVSFWCWRCLYAAFLFLTVFFSRCVHLFPVLGVLSLVIFSPVPHLSAIIKDPAETKVCISATHLATDPCNYGL